MLQVLPKVFMSSRVNGAWVTSLNRPRRGPPPPPPGMGRKRADSGNLEARQYEPRRRMTTAPLGEVSITGIGGCIISAACTWPQWASPLPDEPEDAEAALAAVEASLGA